MIGIEVSGEFIAYIQGDDWGCGVSKIVISLDKEIDTVSKESFKVEETKEAFDWARAELGLRTVKRERRIKRLREAKASNLHVASFDKVIDTRGRFNDDEGNPYNYGGHASWIYFFNNEAKCDECGIDVWSWMAEQ
jgi:hypothetical protein